VRVPRVLEKTVTVAADTLGWLGWRSPAHSTAVRQLAAGIVGDPAPWMAATGTTPKRLDEGASVQDRWFARLYLLKPFAIGALALFWLVTVIALGPGRAAAMAQLGEAGVRGFPADVVLIGGALFHIALGLLLLVRRAARGVLITMLAVTLVYVLAGTVLAPQLWIDPLGPLTKIAPLLVATLFTLAILDER
jgi:DoxX-like family